MANKLINSLNNEEKLLLYSIGALNNIPIRSKTKLQKLLFLFSNIYRDFQEPLEFEPHLLGPYSETIDYMLEDLMRLDLIDKRNRGYLLTSKGHEIYAELKPDKEVMKVIEDFKEFLNNMSDDEVLTFIYVFYPKYIAESARWDELKKNRINIAVSLLKKQKISFNKAVEIADVNIDRFENLLLERKVRWKQ